MSSAQPHSLGAVVPAASSFYDQNYANWCDDTLFEAFLEILERGGPVSGLAARVRPWRGAFQEIAARLRREHGVVLGAYFRTPEGIGFINPFNTEHLARLLHSFSHQLFLDGADPQVLDSLYYIVKSQCQMHLFYSMPNPPFFFAFHAFGAVLGYGEFGRFLVMTQNSTIGQNQNQYPCLGEGVILAPGATVLGDCKIGDNVLLAAGSLVIDQTIPDNTVVIGRPPQLRMKPNDGDNRAQNFDLDAIERLRSN